MSSFIIKRPKKNVDIKFIEDIPENDAKFTIPNINTTKLEKENIMKDLRIKIDTNLSDTSKSSLDFFSKKKKKPTKEGETDIEKITTNLESLGISNNVNKSNYITVSNNVKVKLFTNCSEIGEVLPEHTTINCWWCRHSFDTNPIGLPIKYTNESFNTEGIFCSFNCCSAYLNTQNKNDIYYKNSSSLLLLLYKQIFNSFPHQMIVPQAPDWKLLKDYGGTLTIEQYRKSIPDIVKLTPNYKLKKQMKPIEIIYTDQ